MVYQVSRISYYVSQVSADVPSRHMCTPLIYACAVYTDTDHTSIYHMCINFHVCAMQALSSSSVIPPKSVPWPPRASSVLPPKSVPKDARSALAQVCRPTI